MIRTVELRDLGVVEYGKAWALQKELVARRLDGEGLDVLLLLEHTPVYTVGRRGTIEGLEALGLPVYEVERGGDVTYHGPGQLVGYPILELPRGKLEIKAYITDLEEALIRSVADFGIEAGRGVHAGVWVGPQKLASIGVAIKGHVTYHGFALNVNNDLGPFLKVNPCGLEGTTLTSTMEVLGRELAMGEVKRAFVRHFARVYDAEVWASSKNVSPPLFETSDKGSLQSRR